MAYLHCHNCEWQQDDFWHKGYTPLHGGHFESVRRILFEALDEPHTKRFICFNKQEAEEAGIPFVEKDGKAVVLISEYVARELERRARNIRNMTHWTEDEYRNAPRCCPTCGSDQLDVD